MRDLYCNARGFFQFEYIAFLTLGTIDIWVRRILGCGAVLCIVGCLTATLALKIVTNSDDSNKK